MKGGALVLAAGISRRFGSDKRLFEVDGKALLRRTLESVQAAGLRCRVCLRPGDGDIVPVLNLPGLEFIECDDAARGMGATLAQGVAACGDWDGLLVVLGDMAWVRAETLATLYAALTPDVIVQPLYRGDAGSPVAGNPVAGSPVAGSPVAGSPVAGNPVAGNPVAGSPVAGSPVAGNPVAGNPVGFGAKFFPALRALDGDRGGRVVVEQYRECLRQVETNDPGVLRDLDEPPAKN